MRTYQPFVGRLYFLMGSGGFKSQYATTSSPLRGRGMILNSHTDLEGVGGERVCSEMKTMNVKQKVLQWSEGGSGAEEA